MNERVFTSLQRIVRLYRDSNLRRNDMKDDSPFRHTLAGFESMIMKPQKT